MTIADSPSAPTWTNRIIGSGSEAPEQLLANPRNFRRHPAHQQNALKGVLEQVGWVQDVIVNQRTGFLVDGHLRVELAMRQGQAEIPVKYVDLSPDEEALVLATLDPIGALATADSEALAALLEDVTTQDEAILSLLSDLFAEHGFDLSSVQFKEYDESVADDVQYVDCPACGHRFPK